MKFPWSKAKNQYYLQIESNLFIKYDAKELGELVMKRIEDTDVIEGITDAMFKSATLSEDMLDVLHNEVADRNVFHGFSTWFKRSGFNPENTYEFTHHKNGTVVGATDRKRIVSYKINTYYTIMKKDLEPKTFEFETDFGGILKIK